MLVMVCFGYSHKLCLGRRHDQGGQGRKCQPKQLDCPNIRAFQMIYVREIFVVLFVTNIPLDEHSFYSVQPSFFTPNTSFKRTRPHKLIWRWGGNGKKHGISENKRCRLVKERFSLEVKSSNDKQMIIVCHFKKSPQIKIYEEKGIFCVNLSSQMREILFKESSFLLAGKHEPTESRIYKGCKRRQFWPQCRKRESCSLLHFSQIPFTYFLFKEHLMWSISTLDKNMTKVLQKFHLHWPSHSKSQLQCYTRCYQNHFCILWSICTVCLNWHITLQCGLYIYDELYLVPNAHYI